MFIHYLIAGHFVSINTSNPNKLDSLLPSFQPFRVVEKTDTDALFVLTNGAALTQHGELMRSFDWEGVRCTMYRTESGYFVVLVDLNSGETEMMECCNNWKEVRTSICEQELNNGFFLNYFMMMAYGFASADKDTLMMHASVIESQGKGMLFLGKSGTGKSTHSRLWLENVENALLLNDDNPIVRLMPDGKVYVFGSPWSGKTPCYRNHQVEVGAFVRLKQAPYNKLEVLSPTHSFAALLPSCSNMVWDRLVNTAVCKTVASVAVKSRVAHLECLPNRGAVELSHGLL